MSNKKKQTSRGREAGAEADWKHLLSVGSLVGAVLFTLILGAALQAAPDAGDSSGSLVATGSPTDRPPRLLGPATPQVEPRQAPAGEHGDLADLTDLEKRATADAGRLSAKTGWTLQFMLACDPENVRQRVESLADDPDFYLLPKIHDGRHCFRVCWGQFATRERAGTISRFPGALRAINQKPHPLEIASAVP